MYTATTGRGFVRRVSRIEKNSCVAARAGVKWCSCEWGIEQGNCRTMIAVAFSPPTDSRLDHGSIHDPVSGRDALDHALRSTDVLLRTPDPSSGRRGSNACELEYPTDANACPLAELLSSPSHTPKRLQFNSSYSRDTARSDLQIFVRTFRPVRWLIVSSPCPRPENTLVPRSSTVRGVRSAVADGFPRRYKRAELHGVGILASRGLFRRRGKNTITDER